MNNYWTKPYILIIGISLVAWGLFDALVLKIPSSSTFDMVGDYVSFIAGIAILVRYFIEKARQK